MERKKIRMYSLYILFGALTTVINTAVYTFAYYKLLRSNTVSNVIAWVCAVLFAYVTNRKWVFESKSRNIKAEASMFFISRAVTGIIDVLLMYLAVDILNFGGDRAKIVTNAAVIVLNYILSRYGVFNKKNKRFL